jgi:hypothetical protein
MPNTEVKLFSANGNWGLPPVRVGRRRAQRDETNSTIRFIFFYVLE